MHQQSNNVCMVVQKTGLFMLSDDYHNRGIKSAPVGKLLLDTDIYWHGCGLKA